MGLRILPALDTQVAEELIWYPELERVLGATEGKKLVDKSRAEHQQVSLPLFVHLVLTTQS